MAEKKKLVYVDGFGMAAEFYKDVFEEQGVEVKIFPHALPAIRHLQKNLVDLVVTELKVAPGHQCDEDPYMRQVMDEPSHTPNYWKIGLHLIREIRGKRSVNRETPIAVNTIYDPFTDGGILCPGDIEAQTIEAGANLFIPYTDPTAGSIESYISETLGLEATA